MAIAAHVSDWKVFFGWPLGGVWGNVIANVVWLIPMTWYAWWHRRCKVLWCFRPGEHPVKGTSWKTCSHHHVREHHELLFLRHQEKHPQRLGHGESHDLEND